MAQFDLTLNKKLALSHPQPKHTESLSWKCWAAGAQDLDSTSMLRPGGKLGWGLHWELGKFYKIWSSNMTL